MKKLIQAVLKEITEKSPYQNLMLTIIGAMVGLIAWGGNNMYQEQKDYNKKRDIEIQKINKSQIIMEYRVKVLEQKHLDRDK